MMEPPGTFPSSRNVAGPKYQERLFRMRSVYLLLALLAAALSLPGQTFRGEIKGTVEDSSGAVLPGTSVTAVNRATGVGRATVSGSNGDFSFPDIPPGMYTVTVTKAGFQEQKSELEVVVSR